MARCRTLPHALNGRGGTPIARNLLSQVPKSAQPWVATLLRTIFEQPDTDAVRAQMAHVLDALEAKFPKAAAHLDNAQHDLPAFTAFPREIWRQIRSNNPRERLNKEIRRRTDVVGNGDASAALGPAVAEEVKGSVYLNTAEIKTWLTYTPASTCISPSARPGLTKSSDGLAC